MDKNLVAAMRARRLLIRERWEALMRTERANSPMADPDLLVHLLDDTLHEIFTILSGTDCGETAPTLPHAAGSAECPCGSNPLIAYFIAGEQAMLEGLILVQAEAETFDPVQRDRAVDTLLLVFRTIAHREISGFCGVCQLNRVMVKSATTRHAHPRQSHALWVPAENERKQCADPAEMP